MKVVLFDRDGTVIVEPADTGALTMDTLELFPDTSEALARLADSGIALVFVTNQNITNGVLSQAEFDATETKLREMLKPTGVKILKTYLCPHDIDIGCDCRKPQPKMLLEATEEFDLDPAETYMVGDRITDIQAGVAGGLKTILVKAGNFPTDGAEPTYEALNLSQAVDYIIKTSVS